MIQNVYLRPYNLFEVSNIDHSFVDISDSVCVRDSACVVDFIHENKE